MRLVVQLTLEHGRVIEAVHNDGGEDATVAGQAKRWARAGTEWGRVVDVDASRGERNQWHHLANQRLRLEYAGGVRSMTQIQQLLDLGVERVVVGRHAVRNPQWARELAIVFPGRIVVALDARDGHAVIEGEDTGRPAADVARTLDQNGLAAIHITSRDQDGRIVVDRELVRRLRREVRAAVSVSARTSDDIAWLEGEGVQGCVVGQAAYEGTLPLADAIRAHPDRNPVPMPRRPRVADEATEEWDGGDEPGLEDDA